MVNIEKILELLPHRYPLLLVDRLIEVSDDFKRCKGLKNVTINEPHFTGHYPNNPIMPGVLILETMAQVGAAATMLQPAWAGRIPLIGAMDDVKFRRIVRPGDQLIVECELLWFRGSIGRMKCIATVEGEVAASMEITFKLVDANAAAGA